MIAAYALLALAVLSGPQDEREAAIKAAQADVEKYAYDEDVGLKYQGVTRGITRAVSAGRCRTRFVLEEQHEIILDWAGITAIKPEKYALEITVKNTPEALTFEFDLADQVRNFAEVFDYLRHACSH